MPKPEEESESEYETDSGSEYEEESEEESEEEVEKPKPAAAKTINKASNPCGSYRTDTTAKAFGQCKCGWPRADHAAKKSNKAEEALNRLKSSTTVGLNDTTGRASMNGACMNFRVDVTASKFGVCKCGKMQSDHRAEKVNPARQALKSLKAAGSSRNPVQARLMTNGKPCNEYQVDPKADSFGLCFCGFKKADHMEVEENAGAAMLRKLKEANAAKNAEADALATGQTAALTNGSKKKRSAAASSEGGEARPKAAQCCIVM